MIFLFIVFINTSLVYALFTNSSAPVNSSVFSRKFMSVFAMRQTLFTVSSFRSHVFTVISVIAQKKMLRINASSVIACMAYKKTGRNSSFVDLIANPMCSLCRASISFVFPVTYHSISSVINSSCPYPTFSFLVDVFEKSVSYIYWIGHKIRFITKVEFTKKVLIFSCLRRKIGVASTGAISLNEA